MTRRTSRITSGPMPAGSPIVIAIDGLRVTPGRVPALLARYRVGDDVDVTVFRGDVLTSRRVRLEATARPTRIRPRKKAGKRAVALRDGWLGRG